MQNDVFENTLNLIQKICLRALGFIDIHKVISEIIEAKEAFKLLTPQNKNMFILNEVARKTEMKKYPAGTSSVTF